MKRMFGLMAAMLLFAGCGKEVTLLGVLDRTATPMGGRLMRDWILRPLFRPDEIIARLDQPGIGFSSGRPKFIYFPKVNAAANLRGKCPEGRISSATVCTRCRRWTSS